MSLCFFLYLSHLTCQKKFSPPPGYFGQQPEICKYIKNCVISCARTVQHTMTGVLPFILNICKVAWGYIHFVAYLFPALLAPCPCRLERRPKSLEIVLWYESFCHDYSPSCILQFTFLFGYVYTVLLIGLNNSLFLP